MRLTTMSRYGTRAIFDIAYHSNGLSTRLKDISKRQEITVNYLEQIFHKLKKAKIVESVRGPNGGYTLTKDPGKITVGAILRAVNEHTNLVFCVDPATEDCEPCHRAKECVTRPVWKEAGRIIVEYFESVTIADLCKKAKEIGVKRTIEHTFEYVI